MTDNDVSQHDIDSFTRLVVHLHGKEDLELIILKAHLLIEEQLRTIIEARIPGHAALGMNDSIWAFNHIARLAEALCSGEEHESLWKGVRKLNRIRNALAHHLEPQGLSDQIDDLNQSWPSRADHDQQRYLIHTLASMLVALSGLVRTPSARLGLAAEQLSTDTFNASPKAIKKVDK
jgi:hypothetical protein